MAGISASVTVGDGQTATVFHGSQKRCLGSHELAKRHWGGHILCVERVCGNGTCNIPVCETAKLHVTKFGFAEYSAMMQRGRSECEPAMM